MQSHCCCFKISSFFFVQNFDEKRYFWSNTLSACHKINLRSERLDFLIFFSIFFRFEMLYFVFVCLMFAVVFLLLRKTILQIFVSVSYRLLGCLINIHCCIFWPANGFRASHSLVEICNFDFFRHFPHFLLIWCKWLFPARIL